MSMIHYRPARADEINATIDLFMTALADTYARHGIMNPLPERKTIEQLYGYIFRTGIFHVAEIEGRLAAICHAVVRDQLWFLSGFWALPELRGKRIGGQLLRSVWAEGEALGARKFFTWSSVDLTAMASYMRAGMLPGYQLLTFIGAPDKLPPRPDDYEIQTLALSTAVRLDERVRETGREIDHQFWLQEAGHEARQVLRDGEVVGYYYYNHGTVGPLAWTNEREAEPVLALACHEAAVQETVEQLRLMIPGINHAALRFALQAGLKLTAYSHLLTTAPIGQMKQYLPSGPSLF
jgi:N-acetylglutamate synthase-like GNAT family acetyltransferase